MATTAIAAAAAPARRAPVTSVSNRVRARSGWNDKDGRSSGTDRSALVTPVMLSPKARQSGQRRRCASSSTSSNSESSESMRSDSCWQARAQSAGKIERVRIHPLDVVRVPVVSIGQSLSRGSSSENGVILRLPPKKAAISGRSSRSRASSSTPSSRTSSRRSTPRSASRSTGAT
jgi:hypothetical protein